MRNLLIVLFSLMLSSCMVYTQPADQYYWAGGYYSWQGGVYTWVPRYKVYRPYHHQYVPHYAPHGAPHYHH